MLRVALVGCGKIAQRHARILSDGATGAQLVAVCDVDRDRAASLGDRYGVRSFRDTQCMLDACGARIDALSILTPSGSHARDVLALAPAGKHILVEKPLALRLTDADRIIRSCDEHRIRLFVVKQNRFNRPIQALRRALEAGRFGRLLLGTVRVRWCRTQEYYDSAPWRGTWAEDGGVLANQASHHIDLLEWMMGDVESVYGAGIALSDIEAEDTAAVVARFANGALGIVEATTATRPKDLEGSISILGERGSVVVGGFAANKLETWNFADEIAEDEDVWSNWSENPPDRDYAHRQYYTHVVDCIVNGRPHLVDGLEGRKSLEFISAVYESIEIGQQVPLRFRARRCRLGETD